MIVTASQLERLYLAYFGRPSDAITTVIFTGATTDGVDLFDALTRSFDLAATQITDFAATMRLLSAGPAWGWWTAYYPPHPVLSPRPACKPTRPTRGQARACRLDARRWKRRRFVQRLRRRAIGSRA